MRGDLHRARDKSQLVWNHRRLLVASCKTRRDIARACHIGKIEGNLTRGNKCLRLYIIATRICARTVDHDGVIL